MSLEVLKGSEWALVGGKYYSPKVQLDHDKAAVQVKTNGAGNITVERAVNGQDFTAVPDFDEAIDGVGEFNIVNAMPGQFIRIVSTVEVVAANVLT